jgi:RHS repeat-associated protein
MKAIMPCVTTFTAGFVTGEVASRYVVGPAIERAVGGMTGNPVDLTTGRKVIPDETDFSLPGLMPIEWSRFYASDLNVDGVQGRGWVLPYLVCSSGGHYLLQTLDNMFFYFGEVPDGNCPVPLQRIENALGHFLHFTRTVEGKLTNISAAGVCVSISLLVDHAQNPIHRRYEYDPAGELIRTLDKLRGEIKYEYEANGQLHSRDTGKLVDSEEFRYDAAANRLNFNTSQFDQVKDNRIKRWRDQEYAYDAWGNLIEKRSGFSKLQTFSYDCENRLVKAETLANGKLERTGTYRYDSLGRRIGKTSEIDGQTEHKHFLWQGLRMLREETPWQSSLYIYEPGSYAPLARVDQQEGETEQKFYYFHTDQIGTPLEMTDVDGSIVWQATYKAWGEIEALAVNEVEQNLRFQGQYFDDETGLHYNTFRYYDPQVGRFITQDPIGLFGGSNLYQYARSTIMWVDPLGLSPCNAPGGYKTGAVDPHGNLSPGVNRAAGHSPSKADGLVQSHHPIQDAWAKQKIDGYQRNSAPATLLQSTSGSPHAAISAAQRTRRAAGGWDNTLKQEFNTSYKEMLDSGVPTSQARKALGDAYKYFDGLRTKNMENPFFDI